MAEVASAVGVGERHHDELAGFQGSNVGADCLDNADRLVAHQPAGLAGLQGLVRPKVAAADAGAGHANEGVVDQAASGTVSIRTSPAEYMTVACMFRTTFRVAEDSKWLYPTKACSSELKGAAAIGGPELLGVRVAQLELQR